MKQFYKSIGAKLMISASIPAVLAIVISIIGINRLDSANIRLGDVVNISAEKIKLGARIRQNLLSITWAEKNIILARTQGEMDG